MHEACQLVVGGHNRKGTLAMLLPTLVLSSQLRTNRQSPQRWRMYPKRWRMVLLVQCPGHGGFLSYLHPHPQISTEGSVKPFFPSFTSTGFSVRVCQTRICMARDTK